MHSVDYLILALILAAALAACRRIWKRRGCHSRCADCPHACGHSKQSSLEGKRRSPF